MKKIILDENINKELEHEQSFLDRADIKRFISVSNEQSLSIHKSEKADLIVAGLDSPGMSGESLCSIIRNDSNLSNISIIIVSLNTKLHHQRCLNCQANAFVTQPVNNAVLLQEIYQLLNIAQRKACRIPVKIKIEGNSGKLIFAAHAENISSSGMLIKTVAALSEGDIITCNFKLPGAGQITATTEIVRVLEKEKEQDSNSFGLKFTDITGADAAKIESFTDK